MDCHFYHTVGCQSLNCSYLHEGKPNGGCRNACKYCDTVCKFGSDCKKADCFYRHGDIRYIPIDKSSKNRSSSNARLGEAACKYGSNCNNRECLCRQERIVYIPIDKGSKNRSSSNARPSNPRVAEKSEALSYRPNKFSTRFPISNNSTLEEVKKIEKDFNLNNVIQQAKQQKIYIQKNEAVHNSEYPYSEKNSFKQTRSNSKVIKNNGYETVFKIKQKPKETELDGPPQEEELMVLVNDPKQVENAEKKALKRALTLRKDYKIIDLVFLIDCTGSMDPYIEMVKDQTINIINKTKDLISDDLNFRVGIVGYRDFDHEESRLEIFSFGTAQEACEFVGKLEAKHGGDGPEDVNGGMQKALELEWNKPENKVIRFLVHIADAPCHNRKYHNDEEGDYFPEGHEKDRDFKELFAEMKEKNISYLFLKIYNNTDKMIKEFKKLYEDPSLPKTCTVFKSEKIPNDGDLFAKIISTTLKDTFKSSSSMTIFDNQAILAGIQKKLAEEQSRKLKQLQDKKLENSSCLTLSTNFDSESDPVSVSVSALESWQSSRFNSLFLFSDNLEAIIENPNYDLNIIRKQLLVTVESRPFAKGTFSFAYHCKVSVPKSFDECDMVLKKPIQEKKDSYFMQGLKKNLLAIMLANSFNDKLKEAKIPREERIYFSRIIYIYNGEESYFIEGFIGGTFTKYTNNSTYVNEAFPLMTAFSHFSYQATEGKYMATDLQGSNNLLTDPAIHSRLREFREHGDRSLDGMMEFFMNHKCNHYCKRLELKSHFAQNEAKKVLEMKENDLVFSGKCGNPFCNKSVFPKSNMCEKCIEMEVDLNKMMGY